VRKTAHVAVHADSRRSTNSAGSYEALQGYAHAFVNHTKNACARREGYEKRGECLWALLKPSHRVSRSVSIGHVPGYIGFSQCLRPLRQHNACEHAERIVRAT
jgi:hypothetical protein